MNLEEENAQLKRRINQLVKMYDDETAKVHMLEKQCYEKDKFIAEHILEAYEKRDKNND